MLRRGNGSTVCKSLRWRETWSVMLTLLLRCTLAGDRHGGPRAGAEEDDDQARAAGAGAALEPLLPRSVRCSPPMRLVIVRLQRLALPFETLRGSFPAAS